MTYEEAIKHISLNANKFWTTVEDLAALQKAIEALEKQIPKKVEKYNPRLYACPNCGNGYGGVFDMLHFCWNCGQAIDWSNDEKT